MTVTIFYNANDSQIIQDSFMAADAATPGLSANDRANISAIWAGGLSLWNTTAVKAYQPGPPEVWHPLCFNNGVLDLGLCDKDTRVIVINGVWARTVTAYGAQNGQPIHLSGVGGLMHRMADQDPNLDRRGYIHTLADDILATGKQS